MSRLPEGSLLPALRFIATAMSAVPCPAFGHEAEKGGSQ